MTKWILKKDIVIPSGTCKAGTPGKEIRPGIYSFPDTNPKAHPFDYGEDEMMNYPDFFEQVEEPVYTRSDMINFARCCGASKGADLNAALDKWHEIQNDFIAQMECKNPVSEKKFTEDDMLDFAVNSIASNLYNAEEELKHWKIKHGHE